MPETKAFWPNQEEAAELLGGIKPSTVLRRLEELRDVDPRLIERDKRGKLLAPRLVLQLAEQGACDVYDVADALLRRADDLEADEMRSELRDEVNGFLAEYKRRRDPNRRLTIRELMDELRASLPPRLFEEIEERLAARRS